MAALTEAELLKLWETGLRETGTTRALTLAAWTGDDPFETLMGLPLGQRDASLLCLRETCFGADVQCEVDCPGCGRRLETSFNIAEVQTDTAPAQPHQIDAGGITAVIRPLTSADLLSVDPSRPDARRELVAACIVHSSVPAENISDDTLDVLAAALSDVDPQADIELSLTCIGCSYSWTAPFDVAAFLWLELDAYVRRLLSDIRTLASAYGWTEAETLAVSPIRRRFYLEDVLP